MTSTHQTRTPHGHRRRGTRLIPVAALLALSVVGLACVPGRPAAVAGAPAGAASSYWARLADRVPAPVLHWTTCRKTAQCATAELPLNYNDPHGPAIRLALLRIKAKGLRGRLGTLFVNPGGPGDPATDFVFSAGKPPAVPASILDRFDIVGVDPRGAGGGTQVRCFAGQAQRARTEDVLTAIPFPVTLAEQRSWIRAAQSLGRACSTTGKAVASAMSSTDDALDMDVLRRAVGDRKLTYLGESYGSYLGQVYANMFPGRVRALVLDGIVDPQGLAGTAGTADVPAFDRIGSAAASDRALNELLRLCQRAGRPRCSFADGDTQARFARLAALLLDRPLRLAGPGGKPAAFSYQDLIADTEHWLHDPAGYQGLFPELTDLARLTAPGGAGNGRAAVVRALLRLRLAVQAGSSSGNHFEAQSAITCADALAAGSASSWPAAATAADRTARYFGAYYAWLTVQCARNTWTAHDADVYRGPFDRRTSAPVLLIGNRWDPATSYDSAVKVARMLPSSRLVSSDSWGHQALLTSACVDNTVWDYLLHPLAPAPKVTYCRGDVQPFASPPPSS